MPMVRIQFPNEIMIDYDPRAHAAYIRIKENKVAKTIEEAPFIYVDLDSRGNLVGIEVINPRKIKIESRRTILNKLANRYSVPALKNIHPEYLDKVYASA